MCSLRFVHTGDEFLKRVSDRRTTVFRSDDRKDAMLFEFSENDVRRCAIFDTRQFHENRGRQDGLFK